MIAVDIAGWYKYLPSMPRRVIVSLSLPSAEIRRGAKRTYVKKRVLLEPATASPKRVLIQAAVEKVVAEGKSRKAPKER
jgi:hypothetical protein